MDKARSGLFAQDIAQDAHAEIGMLEFVDPVLLRLFPQDPEHIRLLDGAVEGIGPEDTVRLIHPQEHLQPGIITLIVSVILLGICAVALLAFLGF